MKPLLAIVADVVVNVRAILVRGLSWVHNPHYALSGPPDVPKGRACSSWRLCFLQMVIVQLGLSTSLPILLTSEYIVIGADSLLAGDKGSKAICKIERVDPNTFFAMEGFTSNETTGFSARETARATFAEPGTLDEKLLRLKERMPLAYQTTLNLVKQADPGQFAAFLRGTDYVVTMAVATIVNGLPKLRIYRLRVQPNGVLIFSEIQVPPTAGVRYYGLAYAGFFLADYVPEAIATVGPEETVRAIVSAGVSLYPDKIGFPISIVRVDASGARWINRPPACQQ